MREVWINKDQADRPNIHIVSIDRIRNIQYGYRIDDPKIKVIKIGLQIPDIPKGIISYKTDAMPKPIEQEMHSFTRNWYNRQVVQTFAVASNVLGTTGGAGYLNCRDFSGTWDTAASYYNLAATSLEGANSDYNWGGASGSNNRGIIIGSGTGAFSFEDSTMTTYTHDSAPPTAGRIFFTGNTPWVVSYDSGSRTWTINHSRFFDNLSGGVISNIGEVGIVQYSPNNQLEERTLFGSLVELAYKQALRIRYERSYQFPSDATAGWLRNYHNSFMAIGIMCALPNNTFGAGNRSLKDTGGTVRYHATGLWDFWRSSGGYLEGANLSNYGLLFGTSNTSPTLEDYALGAIVPHSANFTYGANSRITTGYTAGTKTYYTQITRTVTNVSLGDTTIAEMGLVCYMRNGSTNYYVMLSRVIPTSVTLANGESLQGIFDITSPAYPA